MNILDFSQSMFRSAFGCPLEPGCLLSNHSPSFSSYDLGKLLHTSVPQFPHLYN